MEYGFWKEVVEVIKRKKILPDPATVLGVLGETSSTEPLLCPLAAMSRMIPAARCFFKAIGSTVIGLGLLWPFEIETSAAPPVDIIAIICMNCP
jgi:hypothetical protein